MTSLQNHFSSLSEPRVSRTRIHKLEDIIFISISAIICGAESWNDIEYFGKSKEDWLRTFLELPNGIPSHDTFNRVFSALDSEEFERCFIDWTRSVAELCEHEVIAIDGKTMCGARASGKKSAVHLVSAWASQNNIVLGQVKVDEKSNEITAIPKLLNLLVIKGCIVTIDAMGCQKEIAKHILEKEADYILGLKGNQGLLLEQTIDSFRFLKSEEVHEELDFGYGRIETRRCSVINDLSLIEACDNWKGLKSLIRIESKRYIKAKGKTEEEVRYYISSLSFNAELMNKSIRSHWGVENSLHWILDVGFNEDASRKRSGNAAQNYSIMNRIALNLLKNDKTTKVGIRSKRLKAGWNNKYLIQLLKN